MFCGQCGASIVEGDRFCGNCGASVGAEVAGIPSTHADKALFEHKELNMPADEKAWIEMLIGEVMDARKWSETHISTSYTPQTSTAYVGGKIGYTTTTQAHTSSTNITKHEFFIKFENGEEKVFDFNINVRSGHKLIFFYGARIGRKTGNYFCIYNANTKEYKWMIEVNQFYGLTVLRNKGDKLLGMLPSALIRSISVKRTFISLSILLVGIIVPVILLLTVGKVFGLIISCVCWYVLWKQFRKRYEMVLINAAHSYLKSIIKESLKNQIDPMIKNALEYA